MSEEQSLNIRAARPDEYERVRAFYYALIDDLTGSSYIFGWKKGVYPTDEFLRDSIGRGELYLGELGGALAACMVLSPDYNEGYRSAKWSVEAGDGELLVIHILAVATAYAGRGFAKRMTAAALDAARERGVKTVRLDVLEGNLPAERAYTAVGFRHADTVRMFYEDTGWTDFRLFEYVL